MLLCLKLTKCSRQMKTVAQQTGGRGEDLALGFLIKEGYKLLERNFRYRHAEIDLILRKGALLVFVEVKTRRNAEYGYPEEFVSKNQAKQIIRAAEQYILKTDWQGNIRFDIVSILTDPSLSITHLPDAFY